MEATLSRPEGGWPLPDELRPEDRTSLGAWLDLLAAWNARVDLTAARSARELVDLMVADALVLASRVPRDARVIDVGTGAGAPGLALSILRPDLTMTLVEPLAKRAAFLRTVLGSLPLPHVTLEVARGEDISTDGTRTFDVALSRATVAPPAWLTIAARLLSPHGSVWVFLAKEPPPSDDAFVSLDDVSYTWPLTGAARRLVRYGLRRGG